MYTSADVTLAIATMDRFEAAVETLLQLDLLRFGEVILIDDSSDPKLREWCRNRPVTHQWGPSTNLPEARNHALQICDTALVAFADDDVILPTDFAMRVASSFDKHPSAVAVGGPTLSTTVENARNLCYRKKMIVSSTTGTVHDDSYRWIPKSSHQVGLLKGANMCFQSDCLRSIGGFDLNYGGPAQREDTDVCVRLSERGDIVYDPSLKCFHKQVGSEGFTSDSLEWRFRNHGYFVKKNFGLSAAIASGISLFTRICGNPDSIPQLLFRRLLLRQSFSIGRCFRAYFEGVRCASTLKQ